MLRVSFCYPHIWRDLRLRLPIFPVTSLNMSLRKTAALKPSQLCEVSYCKSVSSGRWGKQRSSSLSGFSVRCYTSLQSQTQSLVPLNHELGPNMHSVVSFQLLTDQKVILTLLTRGGGQWIVFIKKHILVWGFRCRTINYHLHTSHEETPAPLGVFVPTLQVGSDQQAESKAKSNSAKWQLWNLTVRVTTRLRWWRTLDKNESSGVPLVETFIRNPGWVKVAVRVKNKTNTPPTFKALSKRTPLDYINAPWLMLARCGSFS